MSDEIQLSQIMSFVAGTNTSRIDTSIPVNTIYSLDDFSRDMRCEERCTRTFVTSKEYANYRVSEGDVVISLARNQATVISERSEGKIITINFAKCQFDRQQVDPWYFCYLFNESNRIKSQIISLQQGGTLYVSKLNLKTLGLVKLNLADIGVQKKIGEMYRTYLHLEFLKEEKNRKEKTAMFKVLEKMDE